MVVLLCNVAVVVCRVIILLLLHHRKESAKIFRESQQFSWSKLKEGIRGSPTPLLTKLRKTQQNLSKIKVNNNNNGEKVRCSLGCNHSNFI